MAFSNQYMFKVNNTVVIQHKGPGGGWQQFGSIRVKANDHSLLQHGGGKGDFAQWHVEKHGNDHSHIKLKSKKSGKYLRIHTPGGNLATDCGGNGGKWTVFKVYRNVAIFHRQILSSLLVFQFHNFTVTVDLEDGPRSTFPSAVGDEMVTRFVDTEVVTRLLALQFNM